VLPDKSFFEKGDLSLIVSVFIFSSKALESVNAKYPVYAE
jgi:hypothetical protein